MTWSLTTSHWLPCSSLFTFTFQILRPAPRRPAHYRGSHARRLRGSVRGLAVPSLPENLQERVGQALPP